MQDYSALSLAYLGDAVFELCVRSKVMENGMQSLDKLNIRSDRLAKAESQARMYHSVIGHLNPEELAQLKRGRNAHSKTVSKSATVSAYRHATGLEALFGYLYINGKNDRIHELFDICYNTIERITDT